MVNPDHAFHIADYCIFAVTIIVSLGIGIYYALSGGKQRTTSEYFVGNRQMSIIPVAISLMVSFESSIMMLGTPAEWFTGMIGSVIAVLLSIIVAVPIIHPLKITSTYEYLELRFKSRAVRTFGTILGMANYTAYMGIVLFGPAIALEGVTGFPQWTSIVSVGLASVIYTSIGGLKAVIWTDVFQCGVMFAGIFAILIQGTMTIGGIGKTWEIAYEKGRLNFFDFDPDPTLRQSFWSLFVGSMITGFGFIFNQSSVQRISSTPTISDAKKVLLLTTPAFVISVGLAGVEGVIAYSYYDSLGCGPLESEQISNPNQIIPFMVLDIFKDLKGMPGLFMASLFSASLSTLSSGLSSVSALFYTDIVKPYCKPMTEFKATVISKITVVVFGILACVIAFLIAMVGGTLVQITGTILTAFGGPLVGLFMFGAFCPYGNEKGALWGTILSTLITGTLAMGQMTTSGAVKNTKLSPTPTDLCPLSAMSTMNATNVTDWMNETVSTMAYFVTTSAGDDNEPEPTGIMRVFMLSYRWFGPSAVIEVLLFGTIISFCTGRKLPGEVDRRCLIPFFDSLFPFLPECIRKPLRFGYEHKKVEVNGDVEKADNEDLYHYELDIISEDANNETDDKLTTEQNNLLKGHLQPDKGTLTILMQHDPNDRAIPDVDIEQIEPDKHSKSDIGSNVNSIGSDLSSKNISQSVDNILIPLLPICDMEYELLKIDSKQDELFDQDHDKMEHDQMDEYITIDKTEDGRYLRFKSKSIEFDIQSNTPEAIDSL